MKPVLILGALVLMEGPTAATVPIGQKGWFPGSSSIREVEEVPPAYRGRWAPNSAACADQDGVDRIEIMAGGIDTYESGGRLKRVTQAGQERSIKLKLAYEGEGEFWDATETWALDQTGNRLVMADADGSNPIALKRCL